MEYEWFADSLKWAGERVGEFIGWAAQFRAELALLAFAVAGGYAIWKTYELGVLGWKAAVTLAGTAQSLFTKKVAIFGITSKLAMGWVFAIVAALVALGAGLVWLYRNNDAFRGFVDRTWGYMREIASAVASWFMDTAVPMLAAAWGWIADVAVAAWNNYIFPALQGMWDLAVLVFGWIVDTGIPALVGAWQWLAGFFTMVWNDFLAPVFGFLWDVAQAVFGWLVNTGFPAVMSVLGWFGEFFMAIWTGYLEPVLTRLWKLAQWVGAFLVENVFPAIGKVIVWLGELLVNIWTNVLSPTINLLADIFMWLWRNVVTPALEGIGNVIVWAWDNLIRPVFDLLMTAVEEGGGWFTWLLEEIVDPMFTGLGNVIEWVWENVIEPAFAGIGDMIEGLVGIFSAAVEGMGNAWSWLKEFLTTPLRAVIEFVNDYLIGGINTVLGWVGLDGISEITIPNALSRTPVRVPNTTSVAASRRPVAMASGGILDGYSPGVDNFHFRGEDFDLSLAGGEAIMRPEWTRAVGSDWVNQMNAAARTGGVGGVRKAMGFAGGGILPGRKDRTGGIADVWGALGDFAQGFGKFLSDPLDFLTDMFMKGVTALGDNPFAEFAGKAVGKIAGSAKDKLMEMIGWGGADAEYASHPAIPGGMPWQAIWGMVQMLNPFAMMTSGKRSNPLTASGFTSYHSLGRAVDFISPNMARSWQTLAATGLPWTELYYTPMGFMRKGRMVNPSLVSPVTKKNHWDHVHVAMADGGIFPTAAEMLGMSRFGDGIFPTAAEMMGARADAGFDGEASLGVYDSGGILQPGDLAINLGKTPERITTDAQWSAIERAALSGGEGVTYAPQLTSVQGATATEILEETDWEYKRLQRAHKYGRQGG